jgi:hypothetical protein
MSNEKIPKLTRLGYDEVAPNDLFPIVDINGITSLTGESKAITVTGSVGTMASGGFFHWTVPSFGFQTANGLAFKSGYTPAGNANLYCYGTFPALTSGYSLVARFYVPTASFVTSSLQRAFLGVGASFSDIAAYYNNSTYIGIEGYDLIAYADGMYPEIRLSGFFTGSSNQAIQAIFSVDASGSTALYLDGTLVASSGTANPTLSTTHIGLGNGNPSAPNIACTIFGAAVYNSSIGAAKAKEIFFTGPRQSDPDLISLYTGVNLNPGPTQWLDSCGGNHILLPTSGALATNPDTEFHLRFKNSGASGFLGNGNNRAVLPDNYVLTECFMYSSGSPVLSVGSTPAIPSMSSSGIYSWNDNRVPLVDALFNRNNLPMVDFGRVHTDKSLYVFYSASAAPCTFSFEGYVANYGPVTYVP